MIPKMSHSTTIVSMDTVELADAIRQRFLSPVEVMEEYIRRIEERNPKLNALVFLDFEQARQKAKAAEAKVMRGETLGPLHGVPTAIKDLFDSKPGWPTTYGGIRALKNHIADFACIFTERIEQAGAILIGKTNSPILGFRGTTDNYLFGPTANPFALEKNAGGSSGGAAAAVADYLLPFAEATDAGGSIRIPAAWCNLFGYMASFGRIPYVSRPNAFGGINPFIYEGFVTRSVEDAYLILNTLAGFDGRDPFSLPGKPYYDRPVTKSLDGWKIGYSPNLDVFPIAEPVREIVEEALTAFEGLGAEVEPVKLGFRRNHEALTESWFRLIIANSIRAIELFQQDHRVDLLADFREDFPPEYLAWMDKGRQLTLLDHAKDLEIRSEVYDAFENAFSRYDLLVMPTVGALPVDNATNGNTLGPRQIAGVAVDPLIGWSPAFLINLTGHPAASLPAGLSSNGLPVGIQVVGRKFADADVLLASKAYETARPWAQYYPQRGFLSME
jgi:amidase/aspartyl-tRNA(Asn)/glutamyl-tRNA(Gln) amidotransferase subunit A